MNQPIPSERGGTQTAPPAVTAPGPVTGHGSIRLLPERCTSCMICARECPTWCIHVDSHAEPVTDLAPGARQRSRNVLDDFDIDWALCMYCGVCIEQCPFDALEWAGAHVAPSASLADLVHDADQLADQLADQVAGGAAGSRAEVSS